MNRTAPSYGFGTSKRPQSHNSRTTAPGPGAYAIKGLVGSESGGKTLGLKLKQNISSNMFVPGPGTYHASGEASLRKAPSWRIGSSKRDDMERQQLRQIKPPPGSHNPNFDSVAFRHAVWSFGTSSRPALSQTKLVPGVGTYELPSKLVEGPAFVMGLKLDNQSSIGTAVGKTIKNPGPNVY